MCQSAGCCQHYVTLKCTALKHDYNQGSGLRKITRSPKVPNNEILGAQHLTLYEKSEFFQSPKGKS